MAEVIEIKVPDIGDFDAVEIIEVMIAVGDSVEENQDIITLESDKAVMEIPSPCDCVITEVKVAVGEKIKESDVIALAEASATSGASPAATAEPEQAPAQQATPAAAPETAPAPIAETTALAGGLHASPSVRQLARDLDLDLSMVKATGPKGRVTKDDLHAVIKQRMNQGGGAGIPSVPSADYAKFGDIDPVELSRIKKISGKHLHACWLNIPHVTQFDEADITELEKFRKANKESAAKQGVNLTPLVFIMKAVVASLKNYPELNASLSEDKESLIIKQYYNIGVAVDTPNGLVVPVIKDVDKKGFLELATELGEVSLRAREGALTASDMQGGTFSISSLGGIGGSFFTPIVNAPEVAILGVGRHKMQPVWNGSEFAPRLMLPLSLSYDHRVVDGALGAKFITDLNHMLSDIRKVLL